MSLNPLLRLGAGVAGLMLGGSALACSPHALAGTTYALPNRTRLLLDHADPDPAALGQNLWTLRLISGRNHPVDGARVVLRPFMVAHGHGTLPDHFDAVGTGEGRYRVGPFRLFMPGDWRMEIDVEFANQAKRQAVLHVCVPE